MKTLVVVSILVFGIAAFGDGTKKTVYKKTQSVSFDGTDVDGVVRSPDGAYVNQKKGIKFLPLYKVDKSFDREIKHSVEYVR
jgi:uncharacterized spore protein YtfJ